MSQTILSPTFLYPVAGPPLTEQSLLIEGEKIAAIAPAAELQKKYPHAQQIQLPNKIITPGLINAHCHLELGYLRFEIPHGHFVDWVIQLVKKVSAQSEKMDELVTLSVRIGVAELLSAGVTYVGDICKQIETARKALRGGPIRAISFGEVAGLGKRRNLFEKTCTLAFDRSLESSTMKISVSPHAPYTVEGTALRQLINQPCDQPDFPYCMHLAELSEEREFLATLTGRLREAWNIFNTAHEILDDKIPRHAGGPIRWARDYDLLTPTGNSKLETRNSPPPLLAHVNYADDDELAILKNANASVAYCPRTHDFFGHPPHRFRDMLKQGINVCLATDSLASNPDLILMREARHLLRQDHALSPDLLLDMTTRRGGIALGLPPNTGTLAINAPADIAAFPIPVSTPLTSAEALTAVILGDGKASDVWIAGKKVI